jgi:uncharacterized protein (TIGR03437 family)
MSFGRFSRVIRWSAMLAIQIAGCTAWGQVSTTAYRALGQADLRRNGVNGVQGVELNSPLGLALDPRTGQTRLYIADTLNSRVLAWPDVNSYQIGDPPALILGQRGPEYSIPLGIGAKGLNGPMGMAVDPTNGNLYVADVANNRVVRFLAPFDNPGRIEPDAVYGQANFTTRNAGATAATSLNQPRGLAFDPSGNLWVADTGYHRVLRFAAASLNNAAPVAADLVIGQKDFLTGAANGGGNPSASVFDTPVGLAFDPSGNLYVADFRNARVLRFTAAAAAGANAAATAVWGQANFSARGVPTQASGSFIAGPEGIAVDGNGNLYVADLGYNRVVVFPVSGTVGASARSVLGQPDFTTSTANTGSSPLSSPGTLASPADVKLDANGNLFVADGGNNRVVVYPAGARSASRVWGQLDFSSTGVNQVKPGSLNVPYSAAIDYSSAPYALYVSDTANHRVLVWRDSARFRSGDPADLVIGQPNMRTAAANVDSGGTAATRTSLSSPAGLAVNSNDGTLYVADSGNNRVLRFPRPVNQAGRIMPDAVIGQPDFTSSASAAVSGASLSGPVGVALGPDGNLFVADGGNNRVLEFSAGAGNGAAAVRVYGQPNLFTGIRQSQVSPQTLWNPLGLTVDQASNLYVCDTAANRILVFANTQSAPPASYVASYVIGQGNFATTGGSGLRSPSGVAVDSDGNIYVADTGNNRVLMYPSLVLLPIAGGTPTAVVGQPGAGGTSANWDSTDGLATANGLFGPVGVYVDRQDTLYVGDVGNHRLAHFLKPATVVNAATFQASVPLAPGGLATVFSNRLSPDKTTVSATTWPTAVANRQLMINDETPAPIYYLDGGQMNFQMPSNATVGVNRVAVRVADTEELVAGGAVVVNRAAPGLFTLTQSGSGQGAVVNQDGTLNSALNPAPAGSTVVLYGTGQGQVSPAVPDGTSAPMGTLSNTVAVPTSDARTCLNNQPSMCVSFGGTAFGDIKYSGLAPGFIGLWQINVQLPAGVTGNVPVRVTINGTPSNTITIAVR